MKLLANKTERVIFVTSVWYASLFHLTSQGLLASVWKFVVPVLFYHTYDEISHGHGMMI